MNQSQRSSATGQQIPARLFGTNGIRGVVGEELNVDLSYAVGASVALLFKGRPIHVGRDGRVSGRMIIEAVTSGILAHGNDVVDHDLVTTPCLQYLVKTSGTSGGIMITASHNPPQYNGFKVIDFDGVEIPRQKEEIVERYVQEGHWTLADPPGRRITENRIGTYLGAIKEQLIGISSDFFRHLTIVVDVGNGVAALTTPLLLQRLGCNVVLINGNVDGTFPGRLSEPRPDNLTALSRAVLHEKADLGIAHDGDGDRAIFADETGTIHWGDRSFALIEDMVLSEHPGGKVVTPLNSSTAVKDIAEKRKGRLILTKVGSIYVSRKMLDEKAILGGEENGGIFYMPHLPVRDGTIASVLILRAMAKSESSFSQLIGHLPTYQMAKDKVICKSSGDREQAMLRLSEQLKGQIASTLDGIKLDLRENGWILIRPSGTEPLIRLYAEAKTQSDVDRIIDKYKQMVQDLLKNS